MSDFLIIGAGINGLLLARELLAAGATVRLLDRGGVGQEASWAGGGIVSPLYPWRYSSAVTALANWAQAFYPKLAESLQLETGQDVEFNDCGLLMLDAEDAVEALGWASLHGRSMEPVQAAEIYAREPGLAPGFVNGLWMKEIANIRNPRLLRALHSSLQRDDRFTVQQFTEVVAIKYQGGRVSHVEVCNTRPGAAGTIEPFRADEVVVTAGAWSQKLLPFTPEELPIEPVKGQMLMYKFEQPPVDSIVLHQGRYLIPRQDGHLLVGSTLEHVGFDKSVTAQAQESLMQSARTILPVLGDAKPVAQWAGLRPGSPKGIPVIGRLPSLENLSVSSGHFRNGLVLAPASARLLADVLLERQPILDPEPYKPPVLGTKVQ